MKARIRRVKNDYGPEIGVILAVLTAVVGYAYWGSWMLGK